MNNENAKVLSNNDKKDIVKKHIYLSLKRILTQIKAQLNVYSDRKQLIDYDKWHRLIDSTFKRNLRDAHKNIRKIIDDDIYWKKYYESITNFIDYIKNHPIGDNIEDAKEIIFTLWGGIPKFELMKIQEKKYLIYI